MTITLKVKLPKQDDFTVEVADDATVKDLKEEIAKKCSTPVDRQRVIFSGKVLKDTFSLSQYNIADGHTVHMVPSAAPSPASAGAASQPAPSPASGADPGAVPNPFAAFGGLGGFGAPGGGAPGAANPFAAFGGLGGFGGAPGAAAANPFAAMNNPEMLRQMMSSPMVQSLLSNPDFIRSQMESNPMMRQLMQNNPEIAQMMSNPSFIQQAMQMVQNPDLMREAMRNNDRTMLSVENLPGGFDALRQQYQNIIEPMMNAQNESLDAAVNNASASASASAGSSASASASGPNTQPLPNPWGDQQGGAAAGGMGGMGGMPDIQSLLGAFRSGQNNPIPAAAGAGVAGAVPPASPFGSFSPGMFQNMFNNPMVQQMMQQMSQNPALLRQMLENNPLTASMMRSNPMMQEMLNNPEMLAQMMNPSVVQSMFGAAGAGAGSGSGASASAGAGAGAGAGFGAGAMPDLSALLGSFGAGAGARGVSASASAASGEPATVRYAAQIQQLKDMGFYDEQENARALEATGGNVHAAVERLLRSL